MLNEEGSGTHLSSQGRVSVLVFQTCPTRTFSKKKGKYIKNKKYIYISLCSDCQSESPEGQMGMFMENVVLFSRTLVQKLNSGIFLGDSETVLNFLTDQIVEVRQTHISKAGIVKIKKTAFIIFMNQQNHAHLISYKIKTAD